MKANSEPTPPALRIGIVVFDRCQIVDATGPAGVFGAASDLLSRNANGHAGYDISLISDRAGKVTTSSGVSLHADAALDQSHPDFDTLICAGGKGTQAFAATPTVPHHIRRLTQGTRRIVSVCTGSHVLAAAGILDGRRAATHWAHCDQLARAFPKIRVERDPIFIKDGNVYSSAGVTAGMDLALSLVEEDHGRDLALAVARDMVMFMKRPGTQAQYSRHLAAQMAPGGGIRDVQVWLLENLNRSINVEALADRAAMSLRTFNRRFKDATGQTPAAYVQALRVDSARRLLEESDLAVKAIARHCGFGDEERMRRAFHRNLGVSPQDYRHRFA